MYMKTYSFFSATFLEAHQLGFPLSVPFIKFFTFLPFLLPRLSSFFVYASLHYREH
jgi:hypothetical protein